MSAFLEKLETEIAALLDDTHLRLVDIKLSRTKRSTQVRIFLDRDDGYLSHGDCIEYSNKILDLIDARNLIPGDYRLEVSSPGVDRILKERWEFEKNLEKKLAVKYLDEDEASQEISAVLTMVGDDGISLKNGKDVRNIPWGRILTAKVELPW